MLHATIDKQTCTCPDLGVTVTAGKGKGKGKDPILILCRKLDAAGHGDEALTVSRNGTPAVHVRSIRKAALLTVVENTCVGPRFSRFRPFGADKPVEASPVPSATYLPGHPSGAILGEHRTALRGLPDVV